MIGTMNATATTAARTDFVRPAVLAARYDVSTRTVLNWIASGKIKAVKFGKVTRIRFADAVAALEGAQV
jgi:excisionase family DNA binding protein